MRFLIALATNELENLNSSMGDNSIFVFLYNLKPSKALQRTNKRTTEISTPTIIIDIAQKYSDTPLFLSDEVKDILYSCD